MKKIIMSMILTFMFLVPTTVIAKEDKWMRLECSSTWYSSKVTCKVYSTKTAQYPTMKKFSTYLKYKNVKFEKFSSKRREVKAKGNLIYMTSLKEKVNINELLGTLTLKKTKRNNYSVKINKFYYEYNGNKKNNSNWLFLGDSFFDILDGSNMNSVSDTILSNGYYNHTDNKYTLTNGKKNPSLGKISSLGISGATTALISEYFNGYNMTWLPDYPQLNELPKNINKVAIYLGTNDAKKWYDGDEKYSPEMIEKYMENIINKLNEKYNNPEIYILRIFSRPKVSWEPSIFKQYNAKYKELADKYADNVKFVNTEYLSNYQLVDTSGAIRDEYYAFYSSKGYGYAGHLTVDAYDLWVDNIITTLNMNFEVVND